MTLSFELRYEVETPRSEKFTNQAALQLSTPVTVNGFAATGGLCFASACGNKHTLWPTNYYGFEPRVGFAYAPTQRMTVRAAYTLSRLPLSGYENIPDPNFNVASQAVNSNVGGVSSASVTNYITNPVGPLTSAYTALNGFRGPIPFSIGLSPVYVDQSSAVPYTQTWSATVQYQASSRTLVQATYQGLKGTHLIGPFTGSVNIPNVSTLVSAVQNHANLGLQTPNKLNITQNGVVINENGLQQLNPYQNFPLASIPEIYPRHGTMEYNGFYASVNQRFGHGLSLLANYTWSKGMDNVPDTNTGANSGVFVSAQPQIHLSTDNE